MVLGASSSKRIFRFIQIIFLCLFFSESLWCTETNGVLNPPRISVLDFSVESNNPQLEYLGKGFAEFLGVELNRSNQLRVIERSRRNDLIEELNLGLTGLADESRQVELGKILQADYLLMGSLFDIENTLFITFRMVATENTQVILHEKISGSVGAFESLSAEAASCIFRQFDIAPSQDLSRIAEKREEHETEAVVRFSRAIDAIDRGEDEEARKELQQVRKIAPDMEAARYYLTKLSAGTAKFKVIPEPYYSMQNPAYLGTIKADKLFISTTEDSTGNYFISSDYDNGRYWRDLGDDWQTQETEQRYRIGYMIPIGRIWGFSVEGFNSVHRNHFNRSEGSGYTTTSRYFSGGAIGFGRRLGRISAGLSASLFQEKGGAYEEEFQTLSYSLTGGAAYVNAAAGLSADSLVGWSSATYSYVDPETDDITMKVPTSIYNENTLTRTFFSGKTFLIMKQINDIYFDRGEYFLRLLPVLEYYLIEQFSLRGGMEISLMHLGDTDTFGYGVLGGATVEIPGWGLSLDISFTFRQRPSRVIEGKQYTDLPLTFAFSKTGLFKDRE